MKNLLYTGVLMFALTSSHAIAESTTNKGANPKGKPFIEIAGQIVEVQNDIATLEAAHQALVDKVSALDLDLQGQIDALNAEVVLLKEKDALMTADIIALINTQIAQGSDIEAILDELSLVNNKIIALKNDVNDNSDAIEGLELSKQDIYGQLAALDAGIVNALSGIESNSQLIALVGSDVSTLEQELTQAQVDIEQAEGDIQVLHNTKQDDIYRSCNPGWAIRYVYNNGNVACEQVSDNDSLSKHVSQTRLNVNNWITTETVCTTDSFLGCLVYTTYTTYYRGYAYTSLSCPSGYLATGSGYYRSDGGNAHLISNRPYTYSSGNQWYFYAINGGPSETAGNYVDVYLTCMKVL